MQRSKAFSGKKKREQLREKRLRKQGATSDKHEEKEKEKEEELIEEEEEEENEEVKEELETIKPNVSLGRGKEKVLEYIKDLRTVFEKESKEEIEQRKLDAMKPINLEKRNQPWSVLQEYLEATPIEMPKRPKWNYNISRDLQEQKEKEYFKQWLKNIYNSFPKDRLNYFEHNLEVWRQLWRVCERSDIIMLIMDSRFPLFHFPPSLYNYITNDLKKPLILVLNKQDLVDRATISAWKEYFSVNFPKTKLVAFNSFSSLADDQKNISIDKKRKLKKRRWESAGGIIELLKVLKSLELHGKKIDYDTLIERKSKILEEKEDFSEKLEEKNSDDDESHSSGDEGSENENKKEDEEENEKGENKVIIGMVGHPNVGKSSLINGLMGKKVVSASRTPGHTKHFQTINLTNEIVLCDCPGLVFPALDRPKPLQILCGLYPIAQVREPFSAIRYLAERVPVEIIYSLKYEDENDKTWSPHKLCEAFALKRGYILAKSGNPDVHRAGLELLKDVCDGKVAISWPPPGIDLTKYQQLDNTENNKSEEKEIDDSEIKKSNKKASSHHQVISELQKPSSEQKSNEKTKKSTKNKKSAKTQDYLDKLEAKMGRL